MNRLLVFLLLAGFLLSGCAMSDTIYLQNAEGDIVKCGPYTASATSLPNLVAGKTPEEAVHEALMECLETYGLLDYTPMPAP